MIPATGRFKGLFGGRKCVLVTLSGAPLPVLTGSGRWNALTMLQDTHVFRAVGFELLEHLHFDHIEPGLPVSTVSEHLARVRKCVQGHLEQAAVDSLRGWLATLNPGPD